MDEPCRDKSCEGSYDEDNTCSRCHQTEAAYLSRVELSVPAGNYHGVPVPELCVRTRLGDKEITTELFVTGRQGGFAAVATTSKPFAEMGISVRSHLKDCGSVGELCQEWRNGQRAEVIQVLLAAHPCVTARLIVTGSVEGLLTLEDCNVITNLLIDNKMDENEQLS